jgi:hypothetical protein
MISPFPDFKGKVQVTATIPYTSPSYNPCDIHKKHVNSGESG